MTAMTDDEIRSALRELDRPTRPRAEFSDQLFDQLVRGTTRRPTLVPTRLMPGKRRATLRRALSVAAVLIVTIAILAAVLGPMRGLRPRTPVSGGTTTPPSFIATYAGSFPSSPDA